MRNERVNLGEGSVKKRAGEIVVNDIRCLALCLDKTEESVLLWSHRVATETLDKILNRVKWNYVRESFEIDVPDLEAIAQVFPLEERALILEFWQTYYALVQHFLPKAKPVPYVFEKGVMGGMRFHGWGWFSPEK
jgi:hypothetical protein